MTAPRGFREDPDTGALRCPHRDVSCCDDCARAHVEIVAAMGNHYWIADELERAEVAAMDQHLANGAPSPTGNPLICQRCGGEILPGAQVDFVLPDDDPDRRIYLDDELLVMHTECPEHRSGVDAASDAYSDTELAQLVHMGAAALDVLAGAPLCRCHPCVTLRARAAMLGLEPRRLEQ